MGNKKTEVIPWLTRKMARMENFHENQVYIKNPAKTRKKDREESGDLWTKQKPPEKQEKKFPVKYLGKKPDLPFPVDSRQNQAKDISTGSTRNFYRRLVP